MVLVLLLFEVNIGYFGIEGSNHAVIVDSWFGYIKCVLGISKFGFQAITMIKTGTKGYYKQELQDKLKGDDITRGEHVAAITTLYGVKMIALAYRAKYDNGKKAKAKKGNFIINFLATDCVTTLPGIREENKRHHPNGTRSPSKFSNCCKFVEEYYDGITDSNIVDCNAQFLLGIEEAVLTTSIFKTIPCYILGVYASNDFGIARDFSP